MGRSATPVILGKADKLCTYLQLWEFPLLPKYLSKATESYVSFPTLPLNSSRPPRRGLVVNSSVSKADGSKLDSLRFL